VTRGAASHSRRVRGRIRAAITGPTLGGRGPGTKDPRRTCHRHRSRPCHGRVQKATQATGTPWRWHRGATRTVRDPPARTRADPHWPPRPVRAVRRGHASMLLYAQALPHRLRPRPDDIRAFRQWGSRTPGTPRGTATHRVETTDRPARQGLRERVGRRWRCATPHGMGPGGRRMFDPTVYVICSDGDLEEGVCRGAASSPASATRQTVGLCLGRTTTSPSRATPESSSARTWFARFAGVRLPHQAPRTKRRTGLRSARRSRPRAT